MASKKFTEYERLKKLWYKKLEKSGFVDIEQHETNFRGYRYTGSAKYGKFSKEWQDSKVEYYNMASEFLSNYKFSSPLEQSIWEYHTNGMSLRNIADTLKKAKTSKKSYDYVWRIVCALRIKMKEMYLAK